MQRFKNFLIEGHPDPIKLFTHPEGGEAWPNYKPGSPIKDYAQQIIPRISPGGGGLAKGARLVAAARFGNKVIAGKSGGSHSELPIKDLGKPDELGFAHKDIEREPNIPGEHGGMFWPRDKASEIVRRHPELSSDPPAVASEKKPWPLQSYDVKPEREGGGLGGLFRGTDPDVKRGQDVEADSKLLQRDPNAWFERHGVKPPTPQQGIKPTNPQGTSVQPQPSPVQREGGTPNYRAMTQKALQGGTPDNPSFIPGAGGAGRLGGAALGLGKAVANAPKPEPTPPPAPKPPENYSVQRGKPDSLGSTIHDPQGRETGSMWGMQHPTKPNELHLGGIENAPWGATAGEQGVGQHLGAGTMRKLMRDWAAQNKQPGQDTLSMTRTSGANPGDPNIPGVMGRDVKLPLNKLEGGPKVKKETPDSLGMNIYDPKGKQAGSVIAYPGNQNPKTMDIGHIENTSGQHMGAGSMRQVLRQVRDQYNADNKAAGMPPAETVWGHRISGARHGDRVFKAARLEKEGGDLSSYLRGIFSTEPSVRDIFKSQTKPDNNRNYDRAQQPANPPLPAPKPVPDPNAYNRSRATEGGSPQPQGIKPSGGMSIKPSPKPAVPPGEGIKVQPPGGKGGISYPADFPRSDTAANPAREGGAIWGDIMKKYGGQLGGSNDVEGTKAGASALGPKPLKMPGPTSSPGANDPLPSWESPSPSARGINPKIGAEGGKPKRSHEHGGMLFYGPHEK